MVHGGVADPGTAPLWPWGLEDLGAGVVVDVDEDEKVVVVAESFFLGLHALMNSAWNLNSKYYK